MEGHDNVTRKQTLFHQEINNLKLSLFLLKKSQFDGK